MCKMSRSKGIMYFNEQLELAGWYSKLGKKNSLTKSIEQYLICERGCRLLSVSYIGSYITDFKQNSYKSEN